MSTISKKILSLWAKEGLDLTDSAFNKLHSKESKLEEGREKYDLKPEKFRKFAKHILDKVVRMHATKEFLVTVGTDTKNLIKEYSTITNADMVAARDQRWPNGPRVHATQSSQDKFTDALIKSSVIGSYIHQSLADDAREQIEAESDFFTVTDEDGAEHFDGPSYFYAIARLVDPDNGHLVAGVKKQLRILNVKDYNYDVKRMLADFKNLSTRVIDLGGSLSKDDQLLNLWAACATMKEKEFSRFVGELEDREAEKDPTLRSSINDLIKKICAKQTRMEVKNTWNALSQEDAMIMSLVGYLDKAKNASKKSGSSSNGGSSNGNNTEKKETNGNKPRSRDSKIPDWKKEAPKVDEPKEKMVGNRKFYWCTKCRDGQGMWAMHKVHNDNFKLLQRQAQADKNVSDEVTAKKVSFNVSENMDEENDLQIQVKEDLLNNAKAYMSQFLDFQEGGVRGS